MLLRLSANGPFFNYVDKKTDEVGRWQLKCHQFAIMSSTESTQKGEGSQKTPNLDYVIYGCSLSDSRQIRRTPNIAKIIRIVKHGRNCFTVFTGILVCMCVLKL